MAMPNGRCRFHGGLSLKGVNAPAFKHGMRSKYLRRLPAALCDGYREALADPELLSLKDDLGLLTARINQILEKLSESAPPKGEDLLGGLGKIDRAVRNGDRSKALAAVRAMTRLVRSGKEATVHQERCWSELREIIQEKTKTAAAEWRRLNELNGVVTVEQALLFARAFLSAARECVTDRSMLRALQERTLVLLPPAEASCSGSFAAEASGVVIEQASPEQLPYGLKELPPGADPEEYEWVEDNADVDTKTAEEEEGGGTDPGAGPGS
jgi:hypothetical protein